MAITMNISRIRYRDLTPEQKKVVCNGCGPKGLFIKPPDFMFKASCNHHDFNYWVGCNKLHRKKADLQFYKEMLKDAGDSKYYRLWAQAYYRAVRIGGIFCFHWAKKQRTLEDLLILISKEEIKWKHF